MRSHRHKMPFCSILAVAPQALAPHAPVAPPDWTRRPRDFQTQFRYGGDGHRFQFLRDALPSLNNRLIQRWAFGPDDAPKQQNRVDLSPEIAAQQQAQWT